MTNIANSNMFPRLSMLAKVKLGLVHLFDYKINDLKIVRMFSYNKNENGTDTRSRIVIGVIVRYCLTFIVCVNIIYVERQNVKSDRVSQIFLANISCH